MEERKVSEEGEKERRMNEGGEAAASTFPHCPPGWFVLGQISFTFCLINISSA